MRDLGKTAWVIETSWIKDKPKWSADWIPIRGIGYYVLCPTKKKAKERLAIAKGCGQIARIIEWKRKNESLRGGTK